MPWVIGILILILIVAFSVYQLKLSNEAAMRVNAWRSTRGPETKTNSDEPN